MANNLNILNNVITATKDQYKLYYNTECTDADELVDYAGFIGANSNFQIWDEQYDNDHIASNNISKKSYYASGNDLLFQSESDAKNLTNKVSLYDLSSQSMKNLTDKSEIFNLLNDMNGESDDNTLTDSKSKKVAKDAYLNNSKINIKLTRDGFEFTGIEEPTPIPIPTATAITTVTATASPTVTTTTTVTTTVTPTQTVTPTLTVTPTSTITPTPTPTTNELATKSTSDPLYYANDKRVFDHVGIAGNEYLELDSDEMQIISNRATSKLSGIVINDEAINLKGSNITVVAHTNNKYDVYQTDSNNKDTVIMTQSSTNTSDANKILSDAGVKISYNNSNLSVTYKDRTANLNLGSTFITDTTTTRTDDEGIRSQVAGIYDQISENNQDGQVKVNGKIFNYDETQQNLVKDSGHTSYNLNRSITTGGKTTTARQAILADLATVDTDGTIDGWFTTNETKKRVSLATAFKSSSGYTTAEFDELVAELLYSADSKYF